MPYSPKEDGDDWRFRRPSSSSHYFWRRVPITSTGNALQATGGAFIVSLFSYPPTLLPHASMVETIVVSLLPWSKKNWVTRALWAKSFSRPLYQPWLQPQKGLLRPPNRAWMKLWRKPRANTATRKKMIVILNSMTLDPLLLFSSLPIFRLCVLVHLCLAKL